MNKHYLYDERSIIEGKNIAALSYLPIICIFPLVLKRDNDFVLEHFKQGMILFAAEVFVFLVHILLGLWILKLGIITFGVCSFAGARASFKGEYCKLPLLHNIASKITL